MPSKVSDGASAVRVLLARLHDALLEPSCEEVERLTALLEVSASGLRRTPVSEKDAQELRALKNDLEETSYLLEAAVSFQQAWARVIGAAAGGYTSGGQAASLSPPLSLSVRG